MKKISPKSGRKRPKTVFQFIRDLISPFNYAKREKGERRPKQHFRNETVVRYYNTYGGPRAKLTNEDLLGHFRRNYDLYFFSNGSVKAPHGLLMVDVDCHHYGTPEAARAYLAWITAEWFPNLYHEGSTNGTGGHGYAFFEKAGVGDIYLAGQYDALDRFLKWTHQVWNERNPHLQIEMVEVKGKPIRFHWGDEYCCLDGITGGTAATIPRDIQAPARFQEFQETTVLTGQRVTALLREMEEAQRREAEEAKRREEEAKRREEEKAKRPEIIPFIPLAKATKVKAPVGSTTGCVVGEKELEDFPAFRKLAENLLGSGTVKTTGREVATVEDLAIFLLILYASTRRRNADGSMPRARFQANWEILYRAGRVSRAWNTKRYIALRSFLTGLGLIHWIDRRYLPATLAADGEGRAAKWGAAERLMEMVEDQRTLEVYSSTGAPPLLVGDKPQPSTPSTPLQDVEQPHEPAPWYTKALQEYRKGFQEHPIMPVLDPSLGYTKRARAA